MKKTGKTLTKKVTKKALKKHRRTIVRRPELIPFDAARYLTDGAAIAEYLDAMLEANDLDLLITALGDVTRAWGVAKVAKASGLGRESLYKALTPGANPRFDTILKVTRALGVRIAARVA